MKLKPILRKSAELTRMGVIKVMADLGLPINPVQVILVEML